MKHRFLTLCFLVAALPCLAQTGRTVSLNGTWQVALADEQPVEYPSVVPVPGVMSQAEPAFGVDFDATRLKGDVGYDYVWYACDFDLSVAHDGYDNANYTHAFLRLRAKYNALVILNGVEIGYDAHTTYSHGEFDVTRALNFGGRNRLVVRVGSWNTASFPSKDNSSEWWRNSRAPGLCDDVTLRLTHDVAIQHLKLLPDVEAGEVVCTARVANLGPTDRRMQARTLIYDCRHDFDNDFYEIPPVCEQELGRVDLPAGSVTEHTFRIPASMLRLWSPGRGGGAQLYEFNFVVSDARSVDCVAQRFGYRSIATRGRDVLVNGRKMLFRAENIAFPRALNRWAGVMFDEEWIRGFLRVAVEDYGFNYLRMHLGHAYSKWYDVADELGLMIQDEWRFMHDDEPQGDDLVQTRTEFRRWVAQNVNHPSIVVWDQENEGNVRLEALKAELRRYDPTRLWGEDDFDAKHIYEYSETIAPTPQHPVSDAKPSTVLESCRLWINEHGDVEPLENFKTSRTASGWGLWFYTPMEVQQLQADIHADLGTFYRSRRVQAWAPFALLSGRVNGQNYFLGDIADSLSPQPSLEVLRQLNEPLGASIEMNQAREWYLEKTLYKPGSKCEKTLWVWNDTDSVRSVTVEVAIEDMRGHTLSTVVAQARVEACGAEALPIALRIPGQKGCFRLVPRVLLPDGRRIDGVARRLMVATRPGAQTDGLLAFGGHAAPFEGCRSVLANFLGEGVAPTLQGRLVAELRGELIDKAERLAEGYRVQTTRYLGPKHALQTLRTFDKDGKILGSEQSESITFVGLPDAVRRTIVSVVGAVPVDESKLTVRRRDGADIYSLTMIGSDVRHTIRMTPAGELLGAETKPLKR